MVIFWGPKIRLLYNDAYVPMGAKHPESLGQPASHIWAEIWPTIGPMLTGVLRTGQVTFSKEQLLSCSRPATGRERGGSGRRRPASQRRDLAGPWSLRPLAERVM